MSARSALWRAVEHRYALASPPHPQDKYGPIRCRRHCCSRGDSDWLFIIFCRGSKGGCPLGAVRGRSRKDLGHRRPRRRRRCSDLSPSHAEAAAKPPADGGRIGSVEESPGPFSCRTRVGLRDSLYAHPYDLTDRMLHRTNRLSFAFTGSLGLAGRTGVISSRKERQSRAAGGRRSEPLTAALAAYRR